MKHIAIAVLFFIPAVSVKAANTYNKILTDGTKDNILIRED